MKNKNVPASLDVGVTDLSHRAKTAKTVCYVAGRSAGHILPALTHARLHLDIYPHDKILFIATDTALDKSIIESAPHVHVKIHVNLPNVPRKLLAKPLFLWRTACVFFKALKELHRLKVCALVSMGGYVSVPVCFAARCLRVPVTLFELNATPGQATRFLAPYVQHRLVCFDKARKYFSQPVQVVGYPLQSRQMPTHQEKADHAGQHGLSFQRPIILVLGGSQGSLFLNTLISSWLEAHPELSKKVQIIHQTGHKDTTDWSYWYHQRGIAAVVFQYTDQLYRWYACADLIICRAGAGTLFEVAFFGKPCIVIPLITSQTSHQIDNARAMAQECPALFSLALQADIEQDPSLFSQKMAEQLAKWSRLV